MSDCPGRYAAFRSALRERALIFDGAMGTSIHARALSLDDYEGLEGCSEILVATRPDVIRDIHAGFLAVGCDAVETNSFGANRIVLGEYGIAERAYDLNRRAAALAREVAGDYSTPDRPRFVVGSMGPGTKLPTLGHTDFDTLRAMYREQAAGLVDGGADALLIETCQDMLQAKAAIVGVLDYRRDSGLDVPLMVQVTIESTGTMLLGTEIAAALTTLAGYPLDTIGLNCATGPDRMAEHVLYLCQNSPVPVSCQPNAGLPENIGGKTVYPLTPDELAGWLRRFVEQDGVRVVGGCCGTTPEHLKAVVAALQGVRPAAPPSPPRAGGWGGAPEAACASLYTSVALRQQPAPMIVGERTNVIGSRRFKELLEHEDWDGMVEVGREQVRQGGAHALDVCVAYVGRDEARDIREVVSRFVRQVPAPLVIDSTEPPVIETALKLIGGKAIINSINLEEGEERAARVLPLAREHNAAVICMTIDEEGMARRAEKKAEIAERIYHLATEKYGVPGSDLIFDAITFTLATGDEDSRRAGVETLRGIRMIKERLPDVQCILGVSNVSFGLSPAARHVLNSVFLHYAIEHGLDMAIVDAGKIMPLFRIPEQERELARQLIFDERRPGFDPLTEFMALFTGSAQASAQREGEDTRSLEEKLRARIIDGERPGLEALLDDALKVYPPLQIINEILLEGMRVVGDLFGSGQMQLPFVLQSAEVMKAAVAHLEPHMEKADAAGKGTIVLATVKGDVHDIGKNLVDIILTNNGYRVINLGIKQPIANVLAAAVENKADAIGMSGLLVKSTVVMKENLEEMQARGLSIPVLLGGAALTRRYVEQDLRPLYGGPLFYGQDAFEGLRAMEMLADHPPGPFPGLPAPPPAPREGESVVGAVGREAATPAGAAGSPPPRAPAALARSVEVAGREALRSEPVPEPPFWGSRVVMDIPLADVFPFINEITLFRAQWQFRRRNDLSPAEYKRLIEETVRPIFEEMKRRAIEEGLLQPRAVYGYFPCNSEGDDLIVWEEDRRTERVRFTFPRQAGRERLCLADFWRPAGSGEVDLLPCMVVTVGSRASERARELFAENRYRDYLYLHGLSVETAEALAEYWHRHIRHELGIAGADHPDPQQLIKLNYQGCRYAFGYPACPRLEDQEKLFALLRPERIGVRLTEEFQMEPEQSTSALISYQPAAHYFMME